MKSASTRSAWGGGREGSWSSIVQQGGTWTARSAVRASLLVTLLAYVALVLGYATLTPIWQNPDEPAHYNYVAYVAATGGLPTLQAGDWDLALLDRLQNGSLLPGDAVGSIRYESWQPPLFYLAAAPLIRVAPVDDLSAMVLRLRLFDATIGALTLGVAYRVARELMPPAMAVAVPAVVAGVPMFTSLSAAISADPVANLLAATTLLALLRLVRAPALARGAARSWVSAGSVVRSPALGLGVLLGLDVLTKLALGIFVPLALGVVWFRSSRRLHDGALMLGAMTLVVLPWLFHQVTTYGWSDPLATSRHAAVVLDQPRFPGLSIDYLGALGTTTFHSFWAQFGWMSIVAPDKLYWFYGVLVLVALAGLVAESCRVRSAGWLLVLATLGAALLGYVGYNLSFEQFQGRYLFTALVPIAALLVAGWATWMPDRFRALGVGLLGCSLLLANAYALIRVLVLGFAPPG